MKKSTIITILVLLVILSVVGITLVKKSSRTAEIPNLKIAYFKEMSASPFFVAQENGYFKEQGLNVELTGFDSGSQMLDMLITNKANITSGLSWPTIVGMEIEKPGLIKVFGGGGETISGEAVDGLLVRQDSTIKNITDLKGKTIAGDNPRNNLALKVVLKKIGLDPEKDVKIIEVGTNVIAQALINKQADAIFALQPSLTTIAEKFGGKTLETNLRARYITDPYWSGVLGVTTADFTSKNSITLQKVFNALQKAVDFIRTNPNEAKLIATKYTPLTEDIATKVGMYFFAAPKENIDFTKGQLIVDSFVDAGILKQKVDIKQMFILP